MPNKLPQFWQELKRRNVIRVITVYAGAAFVIIELINNISQPLRLPEWTPTLVIVLLAIGFPIVIIFSWIYDIHPEEGMVKTEPAREVKDEAMPKSSNSWKIASYISFVVIVGLIVLNIIPRTNRNGVPLILDKSIAVLPFINDSPDDDNVHIINGTMEAILNNLCKIKDLRVVARTSVEQYRDNPKPITEIGREMNVSYILEGSGQKYGNNIRLTFQLIDARNDEHLWSSPYSREIVIAEIFDLQSDIAQLVAAEIEAIMTPDEIELIEKTPTTSLTAYDLYQRGREEHWKYKSDNDNKVALERAEDLYHDAIEYDSNFALAYTGLARVYWDKLYWETYFSENFLDSVLIFADIAISYDNQIAEAYTVRGDYYLGIGQTEQAIKDYDKAIELNSNSWMAYASKGGLYRNVDFVKTIENFHKAASLNRGSELSSLLGFLFISYYQAGLREKAQNYLLEKLKLDGDSVDYNRFLSWDAFYINEFEKGIEFGKIALGIDSSDFGTQKILGLNYSFLGQYEQSLKYLQKSIERRDTIGSLQLNYLHRLAYAYWQNGIEEEADYYFDRQIDYCKRANDLGRNYSKEFGSYYDLAGVYAFRGDKERAFKNLRIFSQKQTVHYGILCWFKRDPLFESIRHEPEFQQILKDAEANHLAERERVRQWLVENNL